MKNETSNSLIRRVPDGFQHDPWHLFAAETFSGFNVPKP